MGPRIEASHGRRAVGSILDTVIVALLLTVGVIIWWQLVPDAMLGDHSGQSGPQSFAVTVLLTLPLAMLAAGGGWWLLRRQQQDERRATASRAMSGLLLPAAATAGLFVLLLLVTAPVRPAAHDALVRAEPNLAAIKYDVSCTPGMSTEECSAFTEQMAGAGMDAATLARQHGAMLDHGQHSTATHAALTGQASGGADAVAGTLTFLMIALLLAFLGYYLARFLPAAATTPVRRRGSLPGLRSRRAALVSSLVLLVGGSLVFVPATSASAVPPPFSVPLRIPPVLTGSQINLTMSQTDVQIMPSGLPTRMWTYNGVFPGPTIRRPSGQPTSVTISNQLPTAAGWMTTHHHGSHNRSTEDGQPTTQLIPPGGQRTYTYEHWENGAPERAATQWYHDHRMDVTGRNVWNGLAGMFILDDQVESQLPLPKGEFDVPLMIVDRTFDANNQIPYSFVLAGTTGNTVLVNGAPQPYYHVGDRRYRFRVLNASNRRAYTLALSNGQAMTQIGTESGLLPAPITRTQIRVSPGERAEIVVNFAGRLGQNIVLQNTESSSTGTSQIMQFRVTRDLIEDSFVPSTLRPAPTFPTPVLTRYFDFNFNPFIATWLINGRAFDPNRVDAYPKRGTTERWVITNVTAFPHVMHIHDVDFRMEDRNGGPPPAHENGLKESWNLEPFESISLITTFTDNVGRFVLHCHMLEHEDRAMMAQFEVVP